jgi:F0F1-type ATP synthase assembly protein I
LDNGTWKEFDPKSIKEKREEKSRFLEGIQLASNLGFEIAAPLVLGVIGGVFLDNKFGVGPRFVLIGLGIGFVISVINTIRLIIKLINS